MDSEQGVQKIMMNVLEAAEDVLSPEQAAKIRQKVRDALESELIRRYVL